VKSLKNLFSLYYKARALPHLHRRTCLARIPDYGESIAHGLESGKRSHRKKGFGLLKHIPVDEEKAEEHRAGNEIAIETAIDRQRKK
jgi:hypothetical protein